jgi:hypothetical protein
MTSKSKRIYSFREARRVARGHGFESKEEFLDYSCPGAYQLPKNPDEIWNEEWRGWDDFLGIPYTDFEEARSVARDLKATSEDEYLTWFREKKIDEDSPAIRLPFRPDLHFKKEWLGWGDWLGINNE